jgi:hypothetical protein
MRRPPSIFFGVICALLPFIMLFVPPSVRAAGAASATATATTSTTTMAAITSQSATSQRPSTAATVVSGRSSTATNFGDGGTATLNHTVFIFYYGWYSAPPRTSGYQHWDGGVLTDVPGDIGSAAYPLLGAYDSYNPQVLELHMEWMKAARVDVVVLSWWGQHGYEDNNARAILDAAAKNGLKVAFMIEPYAGRTTASIVSDIHYLNTTYGNRPAFYKVVRPTLYGKDLSPRGVYFLYAGPGSAAFAAAMDSLRGTADNSIVLDRMDDSLIYSDSDVRRQLAYSHVDGFFNYSPTFPDTVPFPRSKDYIVIYAAMPGWDHSHMPPYHDTDQQSRENGQYYNNSWTELVREQPEGVAIISFNEWHEGGQIEPAVPYTYAGHTYDDYEGAYGLTGIQASFAYIIATYYWVGQYQHLP